MPTTTLIRPHPTRSPKYARLFAPRRRPGRVARLRARGTCRLSPLLAGRRAYLRRTRPVRAGMLEELLAGIGFAIDAHGGRFMMQ